MLIPVPVPLKNNDEKKIRISLGMFEASLHKFHVGYAKESWKFYTTGDKGILDTYQELEGKIFRNKKTLNQLETWEKVVQDPLLKRRLEILVNSFRARQIEGEKSINNQVNRLSHILISFRARYQGKPVTDNTLSNVVALEPDRKKRQQAYRAMGQIGGKLAPGLVRLMKKRNIVASSLGHKNFYPAQLGFHHIAEDFLISILNKLLELSETRYKECLENHKADLRIGNIEVWDLRYDPSGINRQLRDYFPRNQLLHMVKSSYKATGLDLDSIPIIVDAEEREGKSQHGFCFPIDPPDDIRILLNLDDGPLMADFLLHEHGHALYSYYGSHEEFALRGSPSSFFNEAVANFFGDFSEDPQWLKKYGNLPDELLARYRNIQHFKNIRKLRASILSILFEREAYADPDRNLTELYWQMASKILMIEPHLEMKNWAGIIHYTSHPVYLQNYLVADLVNAQFKSYLRRSFGTYIDNPDTGTFFKEKIFAHAAILPWDKLLQQATGESLNPQYFIDEMLT